MKRGRRAMTLLELLVSMALAGGLLLGALRLQLAVAGRSERELEMWHQRARLHRAFVQLRADLETQRPVHPGGAGGESGALVLHVEEDEGLMRVRWRVVLSPAGSMQLVRESTRMRDLLLAGGEAAECRVGVWAEGVERLRVEVRRRGAGGWAPFDPVGAGGLEEGAWLRVEFETSAPEAGGLYWQEFPVLFPGESLWIE